MLPLGVPRKGELKGEAVDQGRGKMLTESSICLWGGSSFHGGGGCSAVVGRGKGLFEMRERKSPERARGK